MVSVPEGFMLVERSIWTEQQVEAATACITRLKGVPGMRDCDLAMAAIDAAQCKAPDIALSDLLPTLQPHPDPIAWMVGTAFWWTKEEAERDAAETGLPIVPVGPLSGGVEAEQLREVIKHSDAQIMRQSMRISNQRAQLAEAHALLRDSSGKLVQMAAYLIGAPFRGLHDLQDEDKRMTRPRVDSAVDFADARLKDAAHEIRRIANALSASAEPSAPAVSNLPELTDDLREILGRPNFTCHFIAKALRIMGHSIAPKSEDEQAVVIHWLLGHYLKNGSDWRVRAEAELKSASEKLVPSAAPQK
ncbi:hypothetical protein [Pseudomonas fulva]|uniref:hypothetical protein n=1 Tax=Pseudomonas fulva TaxID=47880 RepID=UPI0024804FE1|nr:hypothetical protein [Pseudomonas fulva]